MAELFFVNPLGMESIAGRLAAMFAGLVDQRKAAIGYLQGPLGAGKTTLVRALLRHWGETAIVRSPTYTLIEPYQLGKLTVYHLDLYRLRDAVELEYLGLEECLDQPQTVALIEWPERAQSALPAAQLVVTLGFFADRRTVLIDRYDG